VESNGFQAMLLDEINRTRLERRRAGKVFGMRTKAVTTTKNKNERIAALEPLLANGWVRAVSGLDRGVLDDQLASWPNGRHDDAVDALVAAIEQLTHGVTVRLGGYL